MHVLDANEIFGMTFYTYDRIIESGNSDALVLYVEYLKQSRIQETSKTFSLDKFMFSKLKRWNHRFYKAKSVLKELWLIDIIKTMWADWKFVDSFVRVNYLIDENRLRNAVITYELSTGVEMHSVETDTSKCLLTKYNNYNSDDKIKEIEYVKEYEDIKQTIPDDEYRRFYKDWLKCLMYLVDYGYKIEKNEKAIKKFIEWLKKTAWVYGYISTSWDIARWTLLQKFDSWYTRHQEKWDKVEKYLSSVLQFIKPKENVMKRNVKRVW